MPAKDPLPSQLPQRVDRIVELYGDLLFDLCESVLWSPTNAQIAFRDILRHLRSEARGEDSYRDFERAWVLRIAVDRLIPMSKRHGRRLTSLEQIMVDASLNLSDRLKQFDSYFHRLSTEDQILLLFRDKYGVPYSEIAAAFGVPEGSLKVRRQQALRTLEEWLWGDS